MAMLPDIFHLIHCMIRHIHQFFTCQFHGIVYLMLCTACGHAAVFVNDCNCVQISHCLDTGLQHIIQIPLHFIIKLAALDIFMFPMMVR